MTVQISSVRLKLLGSSYALPGPAVDNKQLLAALERHCGATMARAGRRVARRLGIQSRHLSRSLELPQCGTQPGRTAAELCSHAVRSALQQTDVHVNQLAYLIGHTTTPHTLLPPNIAWVADQLAYSGPYLELRQACTGFANALMVAAAMTAAEQHQALAIVGSETGSVYFDITSDFLNREQLVNYVQMGDGAGAVVLGPEAGPGMGMIADIFMGQLGPGHQPGFSLQGGGSGQPKSDSGFPVFRHELAAVESHGRDLFQAGLSAMATRGWKPSDLDWILPHQVNGNLASLFAEEFDIHEDRVINYADSLGNMGSAAIWVALAKFLQSGRMKKGQRLLVLGAEATKFMYGGFVYTHG